MPEIDISFQDPRISMEHWMPRLRDVDVPIPETHLVPISKDEDATGFPFEWDTEKIQEAINDFDSDRAFVRTDRKSAQYLHDGSFLHSTEQDHIDMTILKLIDSMMMMKMAFSSLAVREWINLNEFVTSYNEPIAPEVRFFIDEGEVLCSHPRVNEDAFDAGVESPEQVLQQLEEAIEDDIDVLREYAEAVAAEFDDGGYSVDFLQAEDGSWYCTDMALYGLYFREGDDDEAGWTSVSYHNSECPHNLEENPPENLPEEPEHSR